MHTIEVSTYVTVKNQRVILRAGTRCACVVVKLEMTPQASNTTRVEATRFAVNAATKEYDSRWGPVPWELAQFLVSHASNSIAVELRVEDL
jgi:hypothetical protein